MNAGPARLSVLHGMKIESHVKQRWHTLVTSVRALPAVDDPRWLGRHWRAFALVNVAAISTLCGDAWLFTCGFDGCPSSAEIRAYQPPEGSRVLDRSGHLLGRLEDLRRIDVPLSRIPRFVREAFIATEDRRFYHHNGLDWHGFFRAAARDVGALGIREGFSTITMQVARNSFASVGGGRTLRRTLLERNLTKDEILALYLNVIYLGNGTYGVEAASRDLFGKSVSRLTLAEAALLAALPKGPANYDPRFNYAAAVDRRNWVIGQMAENQATRSDVKDFGRTLVTDYTDAYKQLADVGTKAGATVPKGIDAAKDRTIAHLQAVKGARFDHQFAADEITAERRAVALYKHESEHGEDAALKAYAAQTLPVLEKDLKQAEACAKSNKHT